MSAAKSSTPKSTPMSRKTAPIVVRDAEMDSTKAKSISNPDRVDRERMIAEAAYFRAANRGFEPGHELEDWLAAEFEVAQTNPTNSEATARTH